MKNKKHKVISISEAATYKDYLNRERNAVIRFVSEKKPNGSRLAVKWEAKRDTSAWLILGKDYPLYKPKPGEIEKLKQEIPTAPNKANKARVVTNSHRRLLAGEASSVAIGDVYDLAYLDGCLRGMSIASHDLNRGIPSTNSAVY